MEKQEPTGRKSRSFFKALDRLSHNHRDDDTLTPLTRRKTIAERANKRHQLQKPSSQRQASYYQVPPLVITHLPPRTRSLTPSPFSSPSYLPLKTNSQTQSPLFSLPEEILLLIYKEVIGDKLIHIVRRRRKLGHTICDSDGNFEDCREDQCRGFKLPSGTSVHTGEVNENSIQLLQTCRKIYADAIPLLYSSNIFDVDSMESFISLSCALLPQRFDSIQAVRLDFRFNLSLYFGETTCFNDWPRWQRTWLILSTMGSLQRLWVRISWPKDGLYEKEERRYLEPLGILTHLKVFELSLPMLKDKEREKGEEMPFTVVRRRRN